MRSTCRVKCVENELLGRFGRLFGGFVVFLAPTVFLLELFDATGGIDVLHLARIEGVRKRRDLHLHEGIFFAFVFDGFFGFDGRTSE